MNLFKGQDNIQYNEDAKITIDNPLPNRYNISWKYEVNNLIREVWVPNLEEKIVGEKLGYKIPIIIMTMNEEMLPACMKDRLTSLQDRLNKGLLNV